MMTQYLSSVAKAGFDEQLTVIAARVVEGGGGAAYVIDIRNEGGAIYRQFMPSDAWAYLQFCDELEDLGFVDELDGEDDAGGQFRSVFRRPEMHGSVNLKGRIFRNLWPRRARRT